MSERRSQSNAVTPSMRDACSSVDAAFDRVAARVKRVQRSSSTSPSSRPIGVSRSSALSLRRCSRCSARLVNMRYGSVGGLVTRSSISTPM